MNIEQTLILSTAHLSEKDAFHAGLLIGGYHGESSECFIAIIGISHGFFTETTCQYLLDRFVRLAPHDMPSLQACLIFAIQVGCQRIIFDQDEPALDALPTYDW